ncbi:3-phosphoshikimate 1-carboxyvinyltransferase [hydrothermal vent metagenome]|uniref:3-phosphoshikimate 1-carboxyvinyltransferase n=1 Tax=hydrothermal vent metagenome TaxID=652676 RepID=A0A3B1DLS5_9ZZZZ
MILTVKPSLFLKDKVALPASKSYSIRAFMIAACGGQSIIIDPSDCDDAKVAMRTAKALGAKVKCIEHNSWEVHGASSARMAQVIDVQESGTVLRFILPLLALRGEKVKVTGQGTLLGRPNLFLTEALRKMGVDIVGKGKNESVPININSGILQGGKIRIDGGLSSQFISALLITCPQLKEDTQLLLTGKSLVSTDYIMMTQQILHKSGVDIQQKNARKYLITGNQKFKGLRKFTVPSDYGLAAFLMGAAVLNKSDVVLTGWLKDDLIQADGHILPLLEKMGVKFQKTSKSIKIKGPQVLKGGVFSLKDCPDLVPIMSILALFSKGKTKLTHIKHARVKESDRISDLREELLKVGAKVEETEDTLIIDPQEDYRKDCLLNPHHDHRLAMAFCVLGTKVGVCVKDIECSAKSYPGFVKDFKAMGVNMMKK